MNYQEKGSRTYLFAIVGVAVLGGFLFGYDTAVISGAEKALEAFFVNGHFGYNKIMHGITVSSALFGCIIGSAFSGLLASRSGRRNSLRLAALFFFLSALGSYYPEFLFFKFGESSWDLMIAFNLYRVLGGIGVGLASAISPMYIAEIAPSHMRGTLVSWNQFAIIFGMLVVYFVNYLILGNHTNPHLIASAQDYCVDPVSDMWTINWGWRYMFVSETVPAALFGLCLFLVPETPRYLVLVNADERAKKVLVKINGAEKAIEIYNSIKETIKEKKEKLFTYGKKVILIGALLSFFQQAIGINVVLYYAPRIFANLGVGDNASMIQTVIMGFVNIIFTLIAIFSVDKFGRKPLLMIGSIGMMIGMAAIAALSYFDIMGVATLIFIIIYTASFMMSWGPICWVLISEIFPNTIRGKAVAIAVAVQWISNWIVSASFPSLVEFNPTFTYSLYGFMCLLSALFVWKMVPETKGKTLEDMNKLWKKP